MAFTVANTYLRECASQASRTKALHKNQQLWSILVKDIMLSQNKLPQPVKDKLIRLAFWSMSYSIRAMGAADLPLACPMPGMYLWNSHPRVYLPIEATGFATKHSLDAGIAELIKGYRMIRNTVYGNV